MSRVIDAGPMRFTASVQVDDSEEGRRYAELNRAASAAKERSYDEAIALLYEAKALKGDFYDDTRLAKFLQIAGRFDDAMAEIHWLTQKAGVHAELLVSQKSAAVLQMIRLGRLINAHEAAVLICKRQGRIDLQREHQQRLDMLRPMREKLGTLVDSENELRWHAHEQEREARRARLLQKTEPHSPVTETTALSSNTQQRDAAMNELKQMYQAQATAELYMVMVAMAGAIAAISRKPGVLDEHIAEKVQAMLDKLDATGAAVGRLLEN